MRMVVVGGVAGGMSCAARARRLDEPVGNCGLPYYVGGEIAEEESLQVQTPAKLAAPLNLDVRPRHEVTGLDAEAHAVTVTTPEGVEMLTYDALVLSPGAVAFRPPVSGRDSPRVNTLRTVEDAVALRVQVEQVRPGRSC